MRLFAGFVVTLLLTFTAVPPAVGQQPWQPGLAHQLQVFGRDDRPAPGGTTVMFSRSISPAEAQQLARSGAPRPGPCGIYEVKDGHIVLIPQVGVDCPEGARIGILLDYHDGMHPITARAETPLEWRLGKPGEAMRSGTIKPIPPPTGDVQQLPVAGSGDTSGAHRTTATFVYVLSVAVLVASLVTSRLAARRL